MSTAATETPIQTIMTTHGLSSLEAVFLWALFTIRRVREHLNVAPNLSWKFVSTAILQKPKQIDAELAQQILRQQGIVCFNVGSAKGVGAWDQHDLEENQGLCTMCSLDVMRGEYDFLHHRPWLRAIFQAIRRNDVDGTRLSENQDNLRRLMEGLGILYPDNSMFILETLGLAMLGVFERAKAGCDIARVFDLDEIKTGVAAHDPEQADEFNNLVDQALEAVQQDWEQGVADVKAARDIRAISHPVLSPILGRKIRILLVHSDSRKVAAAARWKRFDVVITVRSNGHVQVFSSNMWKGRGDELKFRFDFRELAKALRILEANFAQPRQRLERGDWTKSGYVYYLNGTACPWYLAEFLAGLFNGSLSSPDVPPTRIHPFRILRVVVETLDKCHLLCQRGDDEWQRYAA